MVLVIKLQLWGLIAMFPEEKTQNFDVTQLIQTVTQASDPRVTLTHDPSDFSLWDIKKNPAIFAPFALYDFPEKKLKRAYFYLPFN